MIVESLNNIHKTIEQKNEIKKWWWRNFCVINTIHNITNLAFHDLVMESIKICSFIIHTFHTLILCIENTFETQIYWKMQNLCDICSITSSYFIHQHIYLCVKHVFNTWYSCIKCTNLRMNEFQKIFMWWHAKFVMNTLLKIWFRTFFNSHLQKL
jgi:hypothetical protein